MTLLNGYWQHLEELSNKDTTGSLVLDWQQANWELLVEGMLDHHEVVLEPYGEGADCNKSSSRVLYPDRLPTHRVVCKAHRAKDIYDHLSKKELDTNKGSVVFDSFVSLGSAGWYQEKPPFDKILGQYQGKDVVVDFDQVDVYLEPAIESSPNQKR